MTIAVILGTRPEIIKMAPIIRECKRRKLDYFVLHTGQHYSYQMDSIFFEQLELPAARYNLDGDQQATPSRRAGSWQAWRKSSWTRNLTPLD